MKALQQLAVLALVTVGMASASMATGADHGAAHGGQYIDAGGHHGIEMVVTNDALVFHLTDEHKPMNLSGAQFKAVVQSGTATSTLQLTVDGSALKAPLSAPIAAGAKIVLTGKAKDGHALQGRFVKQ